jgi:hypothetical protein
VEFTLGPTQQAVVEAAAHVLDGYQPGRAARGEAEYLAVCPPSGQPVALGGIDYVKIPGAGVPWQLAVHEALQSCGIGTISSRPPSSGSAPAACAGPSWAWRNATRGPARCTSGLGYVAYGSAPESWDEDAPDGSVVRYETVCTLMRKDLG